MKNIENRKNVVFFILYWINYLEQVVEKRVKSVRDQWLTQVCNLCCYGLSYKLNQLEFVSTVRDSHSRDRSFAMTIPCGYYFKKIE